MPKCKFENKSYIIQEVAGDTVRIKNDQEEICVHRDHIKPTNKEAREMLCNT